MANLEQAIRELQALLSQHESVEAFREVQAKVDQLPELNQLAHDMKAYQQEAVLFEKLEKNQAADQLAQELSELPLVQDYRAKMQDVSDLLQYVTKSLEDKINEELSNGQRR
ncbi:YlbF family regulator [Streptococcus dentapri]|uniref:YlbF family regulator n=1 Tax=Streptococcus dentapri TaxID=573564 RepID=A0ABV8D2P9_9STRE